MDNATRAAARTERQAKALNDGFQIFMSKPETKLVMSLIPPCEATPEALPSLLRAAFENGHSAGMGTVLVEFMEAMIKDKKV